MHWLFGYGEVVEGGGLGEEGKCPSFWRDAG